MPLQFVPAPGTILICDYSMGGFVTPEMVKKRPAIVISPRLPHRDNLCSVVPLSTTAPARVQAHTVELHFELPLPPPFVSETAWAKCDMIATVSLARLSFFHTARGPDGRRKYVKRKLSETDFQRVQVGVLSGLGF